MESESDFKIESAPKSEIAEQESTKYEEQNTKFGRIKFVIDSLPPVFRLLFIISTLGVGTILLIN